MALICNCDKCAQKIMCDALKIIFEKKEVHAVIGCKDYRKIKGGKFWRKVQL